MKYILSILALLAFCSCVSMSKKSRNVKVGFTKPEVVSVMGEPDDIQSKGNKEAWQYCATNFGHYVFSIIWIEDDKVIGTSSYSKGGRPASFCDANFEPIRWENAPDSVIEIRNR